MSTASPNLLQGRRVARKFALLALYQLEATKGELPETLPTHKDLNTLVRASAQTLTLHAQDKIEQASDVFRTVSESIMTLEFEHPTNLNSPMGAEQVAVAMPSTRYTLNTLDQCLLACEWVWNVLSIPQMLIHLEDEKVRQYTEDMVRIICEKNVSLTEHLEAYTSDWKTDRLIKMDRLILKLALAEILYADDIDYGVSVNEAVELAKNYSMPESYKFINGVLGKIVQDVKEKSAEETHQPSTLES